MNVLLAPLLVVLSTAATIADAERAFAARCAVVGIHQSFLEHFAADSISFTPEPGPAIAWLRSRPAPVKPVTSLRWGPEQTEAQGDLGWSTGPSVFGADRYSYYFSLWRKQSDGTWKVELDVGTDTKQHVPIPTTAQSRDLKPTRNLVAVPGQSLIEIDRQFCDSLATDPGRQYAATLHADARIHRVGQQPLVGDKAWRDWAAKLQGKLTCKPQGARVGNEQGLGYAYGTWERADATSTVVEKGAYVRVWRYEKRWGIAADIATIIK